MSTEDWSLAANEELQDLILWYNNDTESSAEPITPEDEQRVFFLCRTWKLLKQDGVVMAFLIQHAASLETIQSICHLFPGALKADKLPLHVACECPHARPGVIKYLVRKYPLAASKRSMLGELPIHILLKRENNHLEDVQALLKANPLTNIIDQRDLLHSAIHGSNNHHDVLEFIMNQCPKMNSLKADQLKHISLDLAMALSSFLSQLKVLRLRSRQVNIDGWRDHLMPSLARCASIQRLHVDFTQIQQQRETTASSMAIVSHALNDALSRLPNLLDLTLLGRRGGPWGEGSSDSSGSTDTKATSTTEALVALLRRNTLHSINVDHFLLDHEAIFGVLKHDNTSLSRMMIVSIVDDEQKRKALAKVLVSNTSLQSVSLRSYGGNSTTYGKIEYFTKLNALGRRFARNPRTSVKKFVGMLHDANVRNGVSFRDSDHTAQLARVQLLYGLLRECPSIWSC